jgi:hypothetical protein
MTIAPEMTTPELATCTDSDDTVIRPRRPPVTAHRGGGPWAKSAAIVAAVAVMWLIVLAIVTVV